MRILLVSAALLIISACSKAPDATEPPLATPETAAPVDEGAVETAEPPLDLSREQISGILSEEVDVGEEPQSLPQLVGDRERRSTRLRGEVITNDQAESLSDAVDGFQLKLEVDQ